MIQFAGVVSSCPCTVGTTCPLGATCDAKWADPAKTCQKGLTVVYRCGANPWGVAFIFALFLGVGCYVGGGVGTCMT